MDFQRFFIIAVCLCAVSGSVFADVPAVGWTARYNGTANSNDYAMDIVTDSNGNVIVTGYAKSIGTDYDFVTIKRSPDNSALWLRTYNRRGTSKDYAMAIAVDANSNVIVAGYSNTTTTGYDGAVVKYNSAGTPLWANTYNSSSTNDDRFYDVATDANKNVYAVGRANEDGLIVKYTSSGTLSWVKTYNGSGNGYDVLYKLAVDSNGSVYACGETAGAGTGQDCLIMKYSPSGTLIWAKTYNGTANGWDALEAIAIDSAGNAYVTGYVETATDSDYVTMKYSPSGNRLWTSFYTGAASGWDEAYAIAICSDGDVVVTGYSEDANSADAATVKYNTASGNQIWAKRYNGAGNSTDYAEAIAADGAGNIYVHGRSTEANSIDYLTICYGSDGTEKWKRNYDSPAGLTDIGSAIAICDSNIYVTGYSMNSSGNYDYATVKYTMLNCPVPPNDANKDYFVGAYYYPWYGNNDFHGSPPAGNTTLVYHLNPQMTPQLGWYNQTHADVISQHYKWARYAGINFFVTSYWGSGSTEDVIIQTYMFNNPDRGDIKLCVFLEPSITPVDHVVTPAQITSQTNYLCDYYFNQPCYFRIDGKPVIFIYVTRAMTDPNLTMCISTIRAAAINKGIGEVYIVGDEVWGSPNISYETPRVSLMDAVTNYDVYGNLGGARFVTDSILNDWQSRNTSWKNFVNNLGKQFIPAVSPGFNDRGVRVGHQPSSRKLNNESYAFGTLFSGMLDRSKSSVDDNNMIMVTSWNEWHEDTQIEPVTPAPATNLDDGGSYYTDDLYYNGYGMLYLNILRDKTTMLALCDYDSDGQVGFYDIAFLLDYWLNTCTSDIGCIEADFTSNGTVNFADFAICAKEWTGQ